MTDPPSSVSRRDCAAVQRTIGEFAVIVRSAFRHARDDFASLYPATVGDDAATENAILIDVIAAGRSRFGRRLYQVYADGEQIGGAHPRDEVFPLIEWGINRRVIARRKEFLQFHAASMAHRGQGVIFAADSGSGKSTLAAVLLARGWQYYCDEFALVARDSLNLHAYPKAICLKSGSRPIIERLGLPIARRRDYLKQSKGRVAYVNPCHVRPNAIAEPAPVRSVIFPSYEGGSTPRLTPVPRPEAALSLFRCCFNRHAIGDNTLQVIERLVTRAACFRLEIGDPNATGQLLETTLRETIFARNESAPARSESTPLPTTVELPDAAKTERVFATTRRDVIRIGAKVAFIAPAVLTLSAGQVFAAASNPSGICSNAIHSGNFCALDSDCCSRKCNFGVCE